VEREDGDDGGGGGRFHGAVLPIVWRDEASEGDGRAGDEERGEKRGERAPFLGARTGHSFLSHL